MKNKYIIPIFVPHNGCPNQCIFCNQKKISGQIKEVTGEEVKQTIEEYLKTNKTVNYINIEVAFYGGSFTGILYEKQIELLEATKEFIIEKKIGSLRLSTRPDYITQEILDYLKKYNVKTIELGVQSMNNKVLERSKRGHTVLDVINASKLIKDNGFELGLQMMVGLPMSNEEFEIYTAEEFVKLKPACVRIYPVLVIKDTPLEEEYLQGKYVPYSLEKAVEISNKLYNIFNNNNITVIRIGLQVTDNINEGKDVVAGPFHPAIGELVKQLNYYKMIEKEILNKSLVGQKIDIECNSKDISKVLGNRKYNINKLKENYKIEMNIIINDNMSIGNIIIKEER